MQSQLPRLASVATLSGVLFVFGCAGLRSGREVDMDLERAFTASDAPLRHFAWVGCYVKDAPAGGLVTVESTVGSPNGTTLERRRVGDSVVCDELRFRDGQIERERRYALTDPGVCETFDSLRRAISSSTDFILPGYDVRATPRFAACLIVTGPHPSVLYVEGGLLRTETALRQLQVWQEKLDSKEPIEDGDMAAGLLGAGTFAHPSILLVLSIQVFDQICEIGSGAIRDARSITERLETGQR